MSQIQHIFAVYDEPGEAFTSIFQMATRGLAVRAMQDLINDPNHQFSRHSDDFVLHHLGSIEMVTGEIDPCNEVVCRHRDLPKKLE